MSIYIWSAPYINGVLYESLPFTSTTPYIELPAAYMYLLKHRREYSTGIIERGCGREADKARGGAECLIRLRDHILVQ